MSFVRKWTNTVYEGPFTSMKYNKLSAHILADVWTFETTHQLCYTQSYMGMKSSDVLRLFLI